MAKWKNVTVVVRLRSRCRIFLVSVSLRRLRSVHAEKSPPISRTCLVDGTDRCGAVTAAVASSWWRDAGKWCCRETCSRGPLWHAAGAMMATTTRRLDAAKRRVIISVRFAQVAWRDRHTEQHGLGERGGEAPPRGPPSGCAQKITTELGCRLSAIQRVDLAPTFTFSPLTPAGRLGIVAQALLTHSFLVFTTRSGPLTAFARIVLLLGWSGKVLLCKKGCTSTHESRRGNPAVNEEARHETAQTRREQVGAPGSSIYLGRGTQGRFRQHKHKAQSVQSLLCPALTVSLK